MEFSLLSYMREIEKFKDSTMFTEITLPQGDFKFINKYW